MTRVLEAERLDALPPDSPAALQARRDLGRINAIMGNPRIMARAMAQSLPHGRPLRIAELGASDGTNSLATARRLPRTHRAGEWFMVDTAVCVTPRTLKHFAWRGWQVTTAREDANEWLARQVPYSWDAILINLLLHHWPDAALPEILAACARASRTVIAVEPQRSRLALWGTRALPFIGAHPVTRHDASISVRAGFTGTELSRHWRTPGWRLEETRAGWASHLFLARRDVELPLNQGPLRCAHPPDQSG